MLIFVASLVASLSAAVAQASPLPLTSTLHFAFGKAGLPMRFVDCQQEGGQCRHDLDRGAYVMVVGNGTGTPVEEVAAYFAPSRPGAAHAISFLLAAAKVFSPNASPKERGQLVDRLVTASASTQRGEVTFMGVRYVLRASNGQDIRVYVTLP
jgi:hypothetical protein